MFKLMLRFIMIATGLFYLFFSSMAHAQSLFNFTAKKKENTIAPSSSQPAQAMSPDEFNNAVNAMSQETRSNVAQQLNTQLGKPATTPTAPISAPSNPDLSNQTSAPAATTPANPAAQSLQKPPAVRLPRTQSMPANPTQPPGTLNTVPPSYSSQASPGSSLQGSSQGQPQPYPGFGTGSSGKTTTQPPSNNTGGWNIKY